MKPSTALQTHRDAIHRIVAAHRAANARIFGSVLHGSDAEGSDLDLLVDPTSATTLMDIAAIQIELEQLLGVAVDVLTPNALPATFRASVLSESQAGMSDKTLRTGDYLGHILQAIARIQRYTTGLTEAAFCADEMVQDAVIRNIEIIGEAARNVERNDPAFAQRHAGVPWAVMYGMRNRLSHGYHQIDLQLVWNTVQSDLPVLAQLIGALLPHAS